MHRSHGMPVQLCRAMLASACLVLPAFGAEAAGVRADPNADFKSRFGDTFLDAYWNVNTDQAIEVGYYKGADHLSVPNETMRSNYQSFLDQWLAKLRTIDAKSLNDSNRSDWELLDNQLRMERWQLTDLREWEWNPANYNVAEPFALIMHTNFAPVDVRLRAVLKRLQNVPAYYAAAEESIQHPTREHTQLAIEQNRGALDLFGESLEKQLVSSNLAPDERALFATRLGAARTAIQGYITWLQQLDQKLAQGGARSFRIGRKLYDEKFVFDIQSGDTAEALYRRAFTEKGRVLDQMNRLADRLWPKYFASAPKPTDRLVKIGQVIDKLAQNHVAPDQYIPAVKRLIPELAQWVTDHQLIDLDPSKPLEVRVTPVYERGVAGAGIDAPGPYDPAARTYFNVDPLTEEPAQKAESLLREYNNWMLPVFIIHEAIPGHYVQLLYANRSPSRIKSIFGNGAMIEGWAVYCERMMLESGYGDHAPELWLMYWKWYLRSVTNTILDYSVHVLDMSETTAKDILMREAFQSEEEAAGKWRRLQRSSVQLTSYYSGFSAIYAFRERVAKQEADHFSLKRFHEKFLSYGSAPVQVIEELMESQAN